MLFIVVFILCAVPIRGTVEGYACSNSGVTGVCISLYKCPTALLEIQNRKHPQLCTFKNGEPLVCCKDSITDTPKIHDYDKKGVCAPVSNALTTEMTGQKSWDKCIEYQEQLVFPCGKRVDKTGGRLRDNLCYYSADELIVGSSPVRVHEYTHMALLGYGDDSTSLQWLCGGALISNQFVLTAAHCFSTREFGPVSYVALNVLNRAAIDPKKIHKVKRNIRHPEFIPSKIYNDIGLLELDNPVSLDSFTVPACLHNGESVFTRAISTTWNTNDVLRTNSTVLQKFHLTKFTESDCSKHYRVHSRGGYNESMHICFGDRSHARDVCQDDGGNPTFVKNKKIACMYTIVGITSIGKGCLSHIPGLYTKVDHFIPWIESVVWP